MIDIHHHVSKNQYFKVKFTLAFLAAPALIAITVLPIYLSLSTHNENNPIDNKKGGHNCKKITKKNKYIINRSKKKKTESNRKQNLTEINSFSLRNII